MAAVTVVVQGLPKELSDTGEQAHGPVAVFVQQLRAVLDLATRSHPSISFTFSYAERMPVEGYNLEVVITGLDERLMGSADADVMNAVLTVVSARFASTHIPDFRSIAFFPLGRRSGALSSKWLNPTDLEKEQLIEVATTVGRWIRALAGRRDAIGDPDPKEERPAWAAICDWAEAILQELDRAHERYFGSPLPASVHLKST